LHVNSQGVGILITVLIVVVGYLVLHTMSTRHQASGSTGPGTSTMNEIAKVDLKHPYDNTPAAGWLEGAAGIVPPPAVAVGRYPAAEVADVMNRVKQLIISARLDGRVLATHDPAPVLAQLAAEQVARLQPNLAPGDEKDSWWISSKIANPFQLLPVVPRVTGSMTPSVDDKGELAINTNYLFAYAFDAADPSRLTGPLDIVAVDRLEVEYDWIDDPQYDAASQGMWFGKIQSFTFSANCDLVRHGLLAPDYSDRATVAGPQPRTDAQYFDPTIPIPPSNC
jgi:hypothetical protein